MDPRHVENTNDGDHMRSHGINVLIGITTDGHFSI